MSDPQKQAEPAPHPAVALGNAAFAIIRPTIELCIDGPPHAGEYIAERLAHRIAQAAMPIFEAERSARVAAEDHLRALAAAAGVPAELSLNITELCSAVTRMRQVVDAVKGVEHAAP